MRRLLWASVSLLLITSGFALGQSSSVTARIRVRLLDYKTAKPLKGRWASLSLSNSAGRYLRAESLTERTDANGVAVFCFRTDPPPRVWIALDDYSCAEHQEFATADILQNGVAGGYVDDDRCKPHASSLPAPTPGEVVLPVRRLNLWQRFWRGIE
jgi:hypothetical protein